MTVMYITVSGQEKIPIKENLGTNINTKYAELNPIISADGKTLYFTRRNHPENLGYGKTDFDDDIWYSTNDNYGIWTLAKNIGYPLNNKCFSSVCSVSPDGNRLVLQGIYEDVDCKKNKNELFLYYSDKTKNGWSIPQRFKIKDFYNNNVYADFYLSNDGKTLLMAIEGNDSYGDLDIYVSFLETDEEWSKPLNLGQVINTNQKEYSPFLASDGVSLYFSSKGHGGYGDADVFIYRKLDDSWTNWSAPENLGPYINTSGTDAYYVIPASGEYAYFVTTDNSYGAEDIFRVSLPDNVKPNPVVLISGKVINQQTKEPVAANISYENLSGGGNISTLKSNPETGEYKIILPVGFKYNIKIEAKGYIYSNEVYDAEKITEYTELEKTIESVPIEVGTTVKLNNVYFELSKSELKQESYTELDKVVAFLNENPNIKIEIGGHTDNTGNDKINDTLSENRAKTVRNYIVSRGIQSDRIEYKGYGSRKPISTNNTPEDWALNRRVEFIILDKNYVSNVITENVKVEENKNEEVNVKHEENKIEEVNVKKEEVNFKTEENKISKTNGNSEEIIYVTNFESNQIILTARNYNDLDKVITYLKEHPDVGIEIAGHSDNTGGSEEANQKVSEIRAKAVWEYIISRFPSLSSITYKGYGSKNPSSNDDTEQGRNLNRRVEIIIKK
jgi:outer membrane protein OmpA-like peptidoglycan-associated protein